MTTTLKRPPATSRRERARVITASTVGTTIEFYDFYVYATAAVAVVPVLFFPDVGSSFVNLMASFATFGLAFVARPLGSVIFGHFGDKVGRKHSLVFALLTMGIATFIIGLLPTYEQIGFLAPLLLALMRFGQGIGLGGEWSGAALLAGENAASGKRAQAAMWPQLGAPFGFFLANGLFLILVTAFDEAPTDPGGAFLQWGWRVPFLASAIMVAIGLWVRFKLDETPVYTHSVAQGKRASAPLRDVFTKAWRPVIAGTFIMVGCYTLFYLVTTWILSFGIEDPESGAGLGFAYEDFLKVQLVTVVAFMVGIPLAGWCADRFGRKPTLLVTTLGILAFSFTFELFLAPENASLASVGVFLGIGMFLMGLIFGPMAIVLPELFPTAIRYTGSGIAYNLSAILGAAVAPLIATQLVYSFGVGAVGLYLAIAAGASLVAIFMMRETRSTALEDIE